jgi:hypothetical protein
MGGPSQLIIAFSISSASLDPEAIEKRSNILGRFSDVHDIASASVRGTKKLPMIVLLIKLTFFNSAPGYNFFLRKKLLRTWAGDVFRVAFGMVRI